MWPSGYAGERGAVSMQIDEREAEINGLLSKRSEARRRRAALENELRTAGRSLSDIGGALKNLGGSTLGNRVDYILPKFANVPAICDLGRIKEMLHELKNVQTRLEQLKENASQLGID
jgi:hypothetical protein